MEEYLACFIIRLGGYMSKNNILVFFRTVCCLVLVKSVRRTAIIEASKVIEKEQKKEGRKNDKEKCKRRNNQRVNSR